MQIRYIIFILLAWQAVGTAQVLVPPKVIPTNSSLILDFTKDSLSLLYGKHYNHLNLAVAYDKQGFPIMYFDFSRIYDKNFKPISDTISYPYGAYEITKTMFIKSPYNETTYYLFFYQIREKWREPFTLGSDLYYCKVEYKDGKTVCDQPVRLIKDVIQFSLSCALHHNGKDMWIVTHKRDENRYASFLLSESGITDTVFSQGLAKPKNWEGRGRNDINISPDGKKIAMVGIDLNHNFRDYFVELSNFDQATGKVHNPQFKKMDYPYLDPLYIQFAPDSKSFYVLYDCYLDPCGVSLVHFKGGELDTWEAIAFPDNGVHKSGVGGMILAPDGKIYGIYDNGNPDPNKITISLGTTKNSRIVHFLPNVKQKCWFCTVLRPKESTN